MSFDTFMNLVALGIGGYLFVKIEFLHGRIDAQTDIVVNTCCMVEALNDKVSRKTTELME
jgi:hypothetical protein